MILDLRRDRTYWTLLALCLMVGGVLRFWNLTNQGILIWDEGTNLSEGRWLAGAVRNAPALVQAALRGQGAVAVGAELLAQIEGVPPFYAKPTHSGLIALAMLVLGEVDYAGSIVSALLGMATIVLVAFLGEAIFQQRKVGLLSAALLSVSPFHIHYSRVGLAEADTTFFFVICVLLALHSISKRRCSLAYVSGLCLGIAFTTNYRLLTMIPVVIGLLIFTVWQEQRDSACRRELAFGTMGLLSPILFYQGIYLVVLETARRVGFRGLPVSSYFQQLYHWITYMGGQESFAGLLDRLPIYPFLLWHIEGPVILLLLVAALGLAFYEQRPRGLLLAGWALFPLVFHSLTYLTAPRFIVLALPAMTILVARVLSAIASRLPTFWHRVGIVCILLISIGYSIPIVRLSSGYRSAVAYIVGTGDGSGKHIATKQPITSFYVGTENAIFPPETVEALVQQCYGGYRYLLIDQGLDLAPLFGWGSLDVLDELQPIASFPNPYAASVLSAFEEYNPSFQAALQRYLNANRSILIYDLGCTGPGG